MSLRERIGADNAEVLLFAKGGREFRVDRIGKGEETPREFFYGYFELLDAGVKAAMLSSAGAVPGLLGTLADRVERGFAAVTHVGARPLSLRLEAAEIGQAKVLISYTDGFSLSLGLGVPRRQDGSIVIGGFHGLSDIETRAGDSVRGITRAIITRALARLDHAFFFGPADREFAIRNYGLSSVSSSVIGFGVDTDFWRPMPDVPASDFVVAIGQDHNRDYDLLAKAPGGHPTRIITRQKLAIPPGADHVTTSTGDYFTSDSMTDADLRRLYNSAVAVIVPLRDVHQPSGYSVTLQAMSCGKPVILSKIKGLWDRELLVDGENCLLVPPGDAEALSQAIARVRSDAALRNRLGKAARGTALAHYGLPRIAEGTLGLARLGLSMHAERSRVVA